LSGHIGTAARLDWNTPQRFLAAVRLAFGGRIGLDPCGNGSSKVGAVIEYRLERGEDGLALHWVGQTFVNPPFGVTYLDVERRLALSAKEWKEQVMDEAERARFRKTSIGEWVKKAFLASVAGSEVIVLLPVAKSTPHWQEIIMPHASARFYPRGRIRFEGAKASAPMDCAFVYFGERPEAFAAAFATLRSGRKGRLPGGYCEIKGAQRRVRRAA
jgi:hypothetical protein